MEGKEILLWARQKFWEKGIAPDIFYKQKMSHVREIMDINSAILTRQEREAKFNEMKAKMKY